MDYARFESGLVSLLWENQVESGFYHPAEGIIHKLLQENPESAHQYIKDALSQKQRYGDSILMCLGRMDVHLISPWGYELAGEYLQHSKISLREAAVNCLEQWGGAKAIDLLKSHQEEVPWLAQYCTQVVRDLESL